MDLFGVLTTETKKKNEDMEMVLNNLDKSMILQKAKIFHDSQLSTKNCMTVLVRVLCLLYQGNQILTRSEATELFFATTKLFQSTHLGLRRLVYMVIKELAMMADDVIIVTSSLTRDINSKWEPVYRANAIRALCRITDSSFISGIERFIKQAIVDKNELIASAALVSSYHLFPSNRDFIRRWINEVQEALNNKGPMVQYHALGLIYQLRQNDRMALSKIVQVLMKTQMRSPYAHCMLIRYVRRIIEEEHGENPGGNQTLRIFYDFLESSLRSKSEMVCYEAAKAICFLKDVSSRELNPAILVLQMMLDSSRAVQRFAAVHTLSKVASLHPNFVATCNTNMENLVTDTNRSIATLAITTLLKTGNEHSIDRLIKQISIFIAEISDEFKIIIVEAVKLLCLKFPSKHVIILNFLASSLREEGGYDFKRSIVDSIFSIFREISESKELALAHLCEYIEDCEFTPLSVRILYLLGLEGPKISSPSRCIRYIYNRIILENSVIRVAAVSALARFAAQLEKLRPSILVLLSRCLGDSDDEVRDRATFYINLLQSDKETVDFYILNEKRFAYDVLESELLGYRTNQEYKKRPFDMTTIPLVTAAQELTEKRNAAPITFPVELTTMSVDYPSKAVSSKKAEPATASPQEPYAKQISQIPQFASFGRLFKSTQPQPLTESETEYMIECIKHIFSEHVIFQFNCRNTLRDQVLDQVRILVESTSDNVVYESEIPIPRLSYDETRAIYVSFRKPADVYPLDASFTNTMHFLVKEFDEKTGTVLDQGYEDEYMLEDTELNLADLVVPSFISDPKSNWDGLGEANEIKEVFNLSAMPNLETALKNIVNHLGMETYGKANPEQLTGKASHTFLASGTFIDGTPLLVRTRLVFETQSGVTMELAIRSPNRDLNEMIANSVG